MITTVPVRATIGPDQNLSTWLAQLQTESIAMIPFEVVGIL